MGGTVFLYDETNTLVRVREYRFPGERNKIIEGWRVAIGKEFEWMAIHIDPDVGDYMVNRNGTNATKTFHEQKKEPLKPKIDRPAAVYDNKQW